MGQFVDFLIIAIVLFGIIFWFSRDVKVSAGLAIAFAIVGVLLAQLNPTMLDYR